MPLCGSSIELFAQGTNNSNAYAAELNNGSQQPDLNQNVIRKLTLPFLAIKLNSLSTDNSSSPMFLSAKSTSNRKEIYVT